MSSILKKAFTLIELLVVIAIIGILSGLIIVGMNGMTRQASIAKSQVFNNSLRNSLMNDMAADIPLDGSAEDIWNHNTGTGVGGTFLTQANGNCVQNTCYSFNGGVGGVATTDYVWLADNDKYALTNQMTAMIWVKGNAPATTDRVAFGHWDASGATTVRGEWKIMSAITTGALRVIVSNDGAESTAANYKNYVTSSATPFDGNWHLVGFTFNAGTLTLYVDGVSALVTMTNDGASATSIYASTSHLTLGASLNANALVTTTTFAGLLDSARFYDAPIPTSQIKELYYAGLTNLFAKGQITAQEYSERISSVGINN
ncbi:MAG: LamG-like jellyroll fold domain-containing protein [Candidatus Paceibacterota bacterium]|jgi:prepilin-type N-terminal cleavage/methylation domain-containing protein